MCILGYELKWSKLDSELGFELKHIKSLHSLLFIYVNVFHLIGRLEPYLAGSDTLFGNIVLKLYCSMIATSHM